MSRVLVIALAGPASAVVAAFQAQILGHSLRTYLLIALMGIVLGPFGRVALASATRYLTAAEVSLFAPVETVAASLWAWLFFSEVPPGATLIGGAAILIGLLYGTVFAPTAEVTSAAA